MKIKIQDLTGPALDWAVAKASGIDVIISPLVKRVEFDSYVYAEYCNSYNAGQFHQFNPSANWGQAGPIIEREGIELTRTNSGWLARIDLDEGDMMVEEATGPTPLIAAMRCYVASKLGDEIEIPENL